MKFDVGDFNMNTGIIQGIEQSLYKPSLEHQKIQKHINENYERRKKAEESQIEMNETTKLMNEELKLTNKQLQSINDNLQSKLDKINDNIDFVINTIGANSQISEEQRQKQTELLTQIGIILGRKDEKSFKAFLNEHSGDMIGLAGLLLQVLTL